MVLLIVACYLLVVILLAFRLRSKSRNMEDFFVGGRSFSLWYNVNTMSATAIGSGTTIGVAGLAYTQGISAAWILVGYAIGFLMIALLIAKPLHRLKSVTMSDVILQRFGRSARSIAAVLIVIQYFGITAAQVLALGVLASSMLNISFVWATVVMGVVMTLYTVFGGLFSISLVDVFQMVLIAVGIMVILPFVGLGEVDSLSGITKLDAKYFDLSAGGWVALIGLLAWIIPQGFLSQELWIRIFASKTPSVARKSTIIASVGVYLPYMVSVIVIGLCGAVLYSDIEPDAVIPELIGSLTPLPVQGILYAALLSVLMSTATSVMLVAASNLTNDLFLPMLKQKMPDRTVLRISRVAILVVGGLSIVMALLADGIISLLQDVATPYVGALTPIIVATFFWRRASSKGVIATMVASLVVSTILYVTGWTIFELHPIVINLFICSLILIVTSLFWPARKNSTESILLGKEG